MLDDAPGTPFNLFINPSNLLSHIRRHGHRREEVEETIETPGKKTLVEDLLLPCQATTQNQSMAFRPKANHLGKEFRRILEICIHDHNPFPPGPFQSGHDPSLMPEGTGETDKPDPRVGSMLIFTARKEISPTPNAGMRRLKSLFPGLFRWRRKWKRRSWCSGLRERL